MSRVLSILDFYPALRPIGGSVDGAFCSIAYVLILELEAPTTFRLPNCYEIRSSKFLPALPV